MPSVFALRGFFRVFRDVGCSFSENTVTRVVVPDKQMKCRRTKYSFALRQPKGRVWAQHCMN